MDMIWKEHITPNVPAVRLLPIRHDECCNIGFGEERFALVRTNSDQNDNGFVVPLHRHGVHRFFSNGAH